MFVCWIQISVRHCPNLPCLFSGFSSAERSFWLLASGVGREPGAWDADPGPAFDQELGCLLPVQHHRHQDHHHAMQDYPTVHHLLPWRHLLNHHHFHTRPEHSAMRHVCTNYLALPVYKLCPCKIMHLVEKLEQKSI